MKEECPECKRTLTRFCGGEYKCYHCDKRYREVDGRLKLLKHYEEYEE